MTDSDDVLRNAHAPLDPVLADAAARFITRHDCADLLPMMQLTDADRAANHARWVVHVEAGPSDGGEAA